MLSCCKRKIRFMVIFIILMETLLLLITAWFQKTHWNPLVYSFVDDQCIINQNSAVTGYVSMEEGIYNVRFQYSMHGDHGFVRGGMIDQSGIPINKDEFSVDPGSSQMTFSVNVHHHVSAAFRLRLRGDADPSKVHFKLQKVYICKSAKTIVYNIAMVGLILLAIDAVLLCAYFYRRLNKTRKMTSILLLFIWMFFCIPLFHPFSPSLYKTTDLEFHIQRIEGVAEGLASGQFPVRIQPGWLHGNGYPVSMFYSDLMLFPAALLRSAGFGLQTCMIACIAAIALITTVIMYFCSFQIFQGYRKSALFATFFYMCSIDHLYRIYCVFHLGTFSAMLFYPIVVFALWRLYTLNVKDPKYKKNWLFLLIGYSGLLLTHMVSCLMIGIFTVVTALVLYRKTFREATLIEIGKFIFSSIIVNLWFLVPFFEAFLSGVYPIGSGVALLESAREAILTDYMKSAKGVDVIKDVIGIGLPATLIIFVITISMAIVLISRQRNNSSGIEKKLVSETVFFMFLDYLAVFMFSGYFPARQVVQILPFFLKVIATIQYQTRFTSIVLLLSAFLSGYLVLIVRQEVTERKIPVRKINSISILIIALSFFCIWRSSILIYNLGDRVVIMDPIDIGQCTASDWLYDYNIGNAEYLPTGTDLAKLNSEIRYNSSVVTITEQKREYLNCDLHVVNRSEREQTIIIPVINYYPGYTVKDKTGGVRLADHMDNNQVTIQLPEKFSGTFSVTFEEPLHWRICELISFLVVCGIIITNLKIKLIAQE